jgi:hypothetical protein
VSLRIIHPVTFLGLLYPQSLSCSGLWLSWWGSPLKVHISTINPVQAYESSPAYPSYTVLSFLTHDVKPEAVVEVLLPALHSHNLENSGQQQIIPGSLLNPQWRLKSSPFPTVSILQSFKTIDLCRS